MQSQPAAAASVNEVFAPSSRVNKPNQAPALWPLAVVILFACVVNWPCLVWGLQYGHDHNLHITYLHFFEAQLRTGELYPRWISGLNFGAGSPIFFVQYPLPFYASAGLHRVFNLPATPVGEAHALGLFVFMMGIVSGVASWYWCRELANPIAAMLASGTWLTMPYVYSCDVYYRGAIGEYSALAWIPLVLFFAHLIDIRPSRAIAGMALAFAAIVLSNFFTAVLLTPFLFLYVACRASRAKMFFDVLIVTAALALGLGVAGAYFLPMNANRAFFSVANLVKLGPDIFYYRDHLFPFGRTLFPTGHLSFRIVDLVSGLLGFAIAAILIIRLRRSERLKLLAYAAAACLLVTCAAPLAHLVGFAPHAELAIPRVIDVRSRIFLATFLTLEAGLLAYATLRDHTERLPNFLLASSLVCYFLSARWSEWIWQYAAFLWNIQFPWRFSGMLSVFALGLIAFALRDIWELTLHRKNALVVCAGLWLIIVGGSDLALGILNNLKQPFFTEIKRRVEAAYPAYASISELPTPDQLGPTDGFDNGVLFLTGTGTARLDTVTARHLRLEADCPRSCGLVLKLVYYPLWRAEEASSRVVALQASKRAGQKSC